jgi:hypothetical protein
MLPLDFKDVADGDSLILPALMSLEVTLFMYQFTYVENNKWLVKISRLRKSWMVSNVVGSRMCGGVGGHGTHA